MQKNKLKKIVLLTALGFLVYKQFKGRKKVSRSRQRIKPSNRKRSEFGPCETAFEHFRNMNCERFAKAVRMSPQSFDMLLSLVRMRLEKTSPRKPISPECRLFITLMYLAHGGSRLVYTSRFRVGLSTFGNIIYETCRALWDELNEIYIARPGCKEWKDIANDFEHRWRLPNCIGAIDGKQINIVRPPRSGSLSDNLEGTRSIVLLAVCDARYTFTMVDIGAYGYQSGEIFAESSFANQLINKRLRIPESGVLPNSDKTFPYFFVGDNAFPLKRHLMRPFAGNSQPDEKNYNERISHARMTAENTFGILSARWRILKNDIHALPSNVDAIVKATVLLHNILMLTKCSSYCPQNYADRVEDNKVILGEWRNDTNFEGLHRLPPSRSHNHSREAYQLRNELCQYLMHSK